MKLLKILLILLFSFTLTGCVSYSELNELGIIDMVLIDKEEDNYKVTINMLIPKEDDLENSKIYTATSTSLNECLNQLYLSSTKKISFSHLELLVLTPNIERRDYDKITNLFLKRVDSRNTFSTIITSTPDKLLEYQSKDINNLININSEEEGIVTIKQFDSIIKDILEMGISYVPRVKIEEDIIIEGYQSIYEENKLLSKEESIGYNFITNQITESLFTKDNIGFKITNSRTDLKVNKNKITIKVTSTYQIMSNSSIKDKEKAEKIYNQKIKEYLNAFLKNNPYHYFYQLIEKFNYPYYRSHNNIKLEFSIQLDSSLIDNSTMKGEITHE